MKFLQATLAILVLFPAVAVAEEMSAAVPPTVGNFEEYVRVLFEGHPDIASINAALEAALQRPEEAYSLPDPQLKLALANVPYDPVSFTSEAMTQKQIGVSQAFPAPGKRGLLRRVAEDEAEIVATMLPEKRLELMEAARIAFSELEYLRKADLIVSRNEEILRGLINTALTKYEVGAGLQQNVLHAQLELSKMNDYHIRIRQQMASAQKRISVMGGFSLNRDWVGVTAPALPEVNGDADALLEAALERRPLFRQVRLRIEKAQAEAELAGKDILPDYAIGFTYGQRDDGNNVKRDDFISASISLSIPAWKRTKQDRKIARAMLNADKARMDFESEKLKVRGMLADLLEMEKRSGEQLLLYNEGLLPQAEQTVGAAFAAYQVDKVDFLTLVTSQLTLFNYEVKRDQIAYELQSARARLLRLTGADGMEVGNVGR